MNSFINGRKDKKRRTQRETETKITRWDQRSHPYLQKGKLHLRRDYVSCIKNPLSNTHFRSVHIHIPSFRILSCPLSSYNINNTTFFKMQNLIPSTRFRFPSFLSFLLHLKSNALSSIYKFIIQYFFLILSDPPSEMNNKLARLIFFSRLILLCLYMYIYVIVSYSVLCCVVLSCRTLRIHITSHHITSRELS